MALLFADENFDARVVLELRRLGHDVQTVQEAGLQASDDSTVLAAATSEGRAVASSGSVVSEVNEEVEHGV